jgi:hypothetical protein
VHVGTGLHCIHMYVCILAGQPWFRGDRLEELKAGSAVQVNARPQSVEPSDTPSQTSLPYRLG